MQPGMNENINAVLKCKFKIKCVKMKFNYHQRLEMMLDFYCYCWKSTQQTQCLLDLVVKGERSKQEGTGGSGTILNKFAFHLRIPLYVLVRRNNMNALQ